MFPSLLPFLPSSLPQGHWALEGTPASGDVCSGLRDPPTVLTQAQKTHPVMTELSSCLERADSTHSPGQGRASPQPAGEGMGLSQVIIAWCRGRTPQSAWCTNETQMGHLCSGVQQTMENPTLPRVYVLLRAESVLPAKGAVNTPETIFLCFSTHSFSGRRCNFSGPQEIVGAGGMAGGEPLPMF